MIIDHVYQTKAGQLRVHVQLPTTGIIVGR